MKAPDHIIEAVLETLRWATIYCRNLSLQNDASMVQVNELMEAIHEVPGILLRWPEGALKEIKLHLACFDHKKWKDSPNLVLFLENTIENGKT